MWTESKLNLIGPQRSALQCHILIVFMRAVAIRPDFFDMTFCAFVFEVWKTKNEENTLFAVLLNHSC